MCIILNYIIPKIIKKLHLTSFYNQKFIYYLKYSAI
uniref:Uncharacterized protein n=1 Tax=viral metagenome TaxID=1070528 RepID=A0A6C0D9F6_9ZZZZ